MASTNPCGDPPIPGLGNFVAEPNTATLRKAASEAMLAGALLLSDVQRQSAAWNEATQAKQSEERFRKALESLREALS